MLDDLFDDEKQAGAASFLTGKVSHLSPTREKKKSTRWYAHFKYIVPPGYATAVALKYLLPFTDKNLNICLMFGMQVMCSNLNRQFNLVPSIPRNVEKLFLVLISMATQG